MKYDVIVIGGGAAGLMCAIEAGKRGRSVLVIEHNDRIGNKILISGGGRCNFTNLYAGPDNYLSAGPHFCKSALARFTPTDFLNLVERHQIGHHEKKLGQLFCNGSSRAIVQLLQRECESARVAIRLSCRIEQVRKPSGFAVDTNQGEFTSDSLVVATGGLSFSKLGATDFGYRLAEQFGIQRVPVRPGLVPLKFSATDQASFAQLSGLSVDAEVRYKGATFRENVLVTHRGLSGPAILQISNYCPPGEAFSVDLLPGRSAINWLAGQQQSNKELKTVLGQVLPARFAQAWSDRFAPSRAMHRYSKDELSAIAERLQNWEVRADGTEGYPKAEVTLGGIDTTELSSKTMEARRVPGLFFIGEVVDVTGWLGGYNFQWAWASGHAAGQFV